MIVLAYMCTGLNTIGIKNYWYTRVRFVGENEPGGIYSLLGELWISSIALAV